MWSACARDGFSGTAWKAGQPGIDVSAMASGGSVRAALGASLLVVAALAVGGCGKSSGPGAGGTGKLEVALQDDAVFLQRSYYDRERALAQAQQMGVTRLRVLALWARIPGAQPDSRTRPARVSYDWSSYDSLIDDAARHGIRLQLDLSGPAPAWATGDHEQGVVRPNARLFGEFVAAAARHFKGRVDRYSIWNEPNYVGWLAPRRSEPRLYRALYSQAYAAIKREDPSAQVLIGETAPYAETGRATAPLAFLRKVTCRTPIYAPAKSCPTLHADGYAHHPYAFANPPQASYPGANNVTVGSLGRLTRALDRLAGVRALTTPDGKPLDVYLTEFGYFATGPAAVPPPKRADYLETAFDIAERNPRVKEMLQYILVSPPSGVRFNTSLINLDGRVTPPFAALSRWARQNAKGGGVERNRGPIALPPPPGS
jgi:Cellulase (glycosyl hydrolase family 5)